MDLPKYILNRTVSYIDGNSGRSWGWRIVTTPLYEHHELLFPKGTRLKFPNGRRAVVDRNVADVQDRDYYQFNEGPGGINLRCYIKNSEMHVTTWNHIKSDSFTASILDVQIDHYPEERRYTYQFGTVLTRPLIREERDNRIICFYRNINEALRITHTLKHNPSEIRYKDAQNRARCFINNAVMSCFGLCNLDEGGLVALLETEMDFLGTSLSHEKVSGNHSDLFEYYDYKGMLTRIKVLMFYLQNSALKQKHLEEANSLEENLELLSQQEDRRNFSSNPIFQ